MLIVGAGLSGIGAACHLTRECPGVSFQLLEARERTGGTWDLFRYPGIRSDSDMHTLGFAFRPWTADQAIADGDAILRYIRETATEYEIDDRIVTGHRALSADWSSARQRWTVTVRRTDCEQLQLTCGTLLTCCGYYDYDDGYTPEFVGRERFAGPVIHPQHWPEDLDYDGKQVVVIGSGATAITLVPALAARAGHVTMLQRSPSYVVSLPGEDPIARLARRHLPERVAYALTRAKNVALMTMSYQLSRRRPALMRKLIRRGTIEQLPAGFDVDTHFSPLYDPWDQRLCVCPDGDLFAALSQGSASIVTDQVQEFTERGIALTGGTELPADVIITATGLRLQALGRLALSVDGTPVDVSERMTYRGMMLSGVPNLFVVIGYTNASWTLKADLTSRYLCRLLRHMRAHGYGVCVPGDAGPGVERRPLIDLRSGYVARAIADFPSQGSRVPRRERQNYPLDRIELARASFDDGILQFSPVVAPPAAQAAAPVAA